MQSILSNINIQQLINFITVVEQNGFQSASNYLHMTQSAVSKSIGHLEKTLGFPLFQKETKGSRTFRDSRLTEEGAYLYQYWAPALNEIENAYTYLVTQKEKEKRSVNIAYSSATNPDCFLWPLLNTIAEDDPTFDFYVESCYRSDLLQRLQDGTYDIIFLPDIEYASINHTTMDCCYAAIDNAQILVSDTNPLFTEKTLTLSRIQHESFFIFNDGHSDAPVQAIMDFFDRNNIHPEIIPMQKDSFNIRNAYHKQKALAIIDSYFMLQEDSHLKRIPLEGFYNGTLCVWRRNIHKKNYINFFTSYFPDFSDFTSDKSPIVPIGDNQ